MTTHAYIAIAVSVFFGFLPFTIGFVYGLGKFKATMDVVTKNAEKLTGKVEKLDYRQDKTDVRVARIEERVAARVNGG